MTHLRQQAKPDNDVSLKIIINTLFVCGALVQVWLCVSSSTLKIMLRLGISIAVWWNKPAAVIYYLDILCIVYIASVSTWREKTIEWGSGTVLTHCTLVEGVPQKSNTVLHNFWS